MSRLTEKDEQGNWCLKGVRWEQLHEGEVITAELWEKLYGALWKLMKYEDTGLSSEEVESLNAFEGSNTEKYLKELTKHRWIPVKERMPEDDCFVLVTVSGIYNNLIFSDAIQLAAYSIEGKNWFIEGYPEWENPEVAAWTPLPEVYCRGNGVN